jgi:hypothetical protein
MFAKAILQISFIITDSLPSTIFSADSLTWLRILSSDIFILPLLADRYCDTAALVIPNFPATSF